MFFPYSFWTLSQSPNFQNGGNGTTPISNESISSLKAYYSFSNPSNLGIDSLGNHNMNVTNGTPTATTGKIGGGLGLSALNTNLQENSDSSDLQINISKTGFTVTCWLNIQGSANNTRFITKDSQSWFFVLDTSGNIWFSVYGGFTHVATAVVSKPSQNAWHFYAMWYDTTAQTVNIQIDNGTINSTSVSFTPIEGGPGNLIFGDLFNTTNISLDEIGIWQCKVPAADLTALYNGGNGLTYPFS